MTRSDLRLRANATAVMSRVLTGVLLFLAGVTNAKAAPGLFGANKFDLLLQYTGLASRGDGSPAYLRITRAMGEKAIGDARRAGFAFLRISATGYAPATATDRGPTSLHLWQSDPDTYWRLTDRMFDDLDRAHVKLVPSFLWNLSQFPALTKRDGECADYGPKLGEPPARGGVHHAIHRTLP
jgi:hypothetical protein